MIVLLVQWHCLLFSEAENHRRDTGSDYFERRWPAFYSYDAQYLYAQLLTCSSVEGHKCPTWITWSCGPTALGVSDHPQSFHSGNTTSKLSP